jgi:ABC-type sugar transport system permease subunit
MKNKNEKISDILFVLPQFTLYFLLTIIPFLLIIFVMFTDVVTINSNTFNFIGLGNFKEIFSPQLFPKFFDVVSRTAIFTLLNYSTVFILGFTLALIIYEKVIKAQKAFNIIIFLPYVISGLAVGMFLPLLFNSDTGSLNLLFMKLGWINEAINIKTKLGTTIGLPLIVGWRYAGYNMAIFLVGLAAIPKSTIDASRIDGASYFQRLRYIYIPQIVPSIILATVSCLIGSFGIFDEPVGMGGLAGNENAQVFALFMYRIGTRAQMGTLGMGMALSFIVNIPLVLIAIYLLRLQKKLQY